MQYTTLENLKSYIGTSCKDEDSILLKLIIIWSDMLSTELWDDLWLKTLTKRYDWYGTNRVVLESLVNNVSLIEFTNNNWYTWSPLVLDFIDGYVVYAKWIMPTWYKNIRITFQKWYEKVPGDLEGFFLKYVTKMRDDRITNNKNKKIKSKKIDDLSTTYFGPNELSSRDEWFSQDYEIIKQKYRVFSFPVTI